VAKGNEREESREGRRSRHLAKGGKKLLERMGGPKFVARRKKKEINATKKRRQPTAEETETLFQGR